MDGGNLLYKYYGPNRTQVLDDRLVRFTPLHELNDPYEGRFLLDPIEREREAAVADGFRAEWAEVEVFISSTMAALGVLCLSRCPDSELMWTHYASNHQGFVIGIRRELNPFDGPAYIWSPYRTKTDLTPMSGFGTFRDVVYSDEPFRIALGDNVPFEAFFTKTCAWKYEEEVRIFRSVYEATRVIEQGSTKVYLFEIPTQAFARVIVGAAAPDSVVKAAVALVGRSGSSRLSVERARIDNRARQIFFEPINVVA